MLPRGLDCLAVPTYSYAGRDCEHRFDIQQAFTDDSLTECPHCGGRLRKIYSSVGVVFKGSGFYRNDSRSSANGAGKEPAAAGGAGKDSSGKDGTSKDSADKESGGSESGGKQSSGTGSSGKESGGTGPSGNSGSAKDSGAKNRAAAGSSGSNGTGSRQSSAPARSGA